MGATGTAASTWLLALLAILETVPQDAAEVGASAPVAASARDILDCQHKPLWAEFLHGLRWVASQGYPVDGPVAQQAADLVQEDADIYRTAKHRHRSSLTAQAWEQLIHEMCQGLPGIPQRCEADANISAASGSCFYGDMNARWYLARVMPSVSNNARDLNVSYWVETSQLSRNIFNIHNTFSDWVEESSWPVYPIDLLASAGRCCSHGSFRRRNVCKTPRGIQHRWRFLSDSDVVDPAEVPKRPRWKVPPRGWHRIVGWRTVAADMRPALPPPRGPSEVVRVWELGVHKTLSAEALTSIHRALRAGGRSMVFRNLFLEQYPFYMDRCALYTKMQCNDERDAISEVVTSAIVQAVPYLGSDMASMEFQYKPDWSWGELEDFGRRLAGAIQAWGLLVDLFVVTQPVCFLVPFGLTPGLRDVPLLMYTASHAGYMQGKGTSRLFSEFFQRSLLGRTGATFVTMFAWNAFMYEGALRVRLPVIGGMSLYMGVMPQPVPSRGLYVLRKDQPDDCLMQCLMLRIAREVGFADEISFIGDFKATYREMAKFRAAALFPYVSFSMTFEELGNLAVPIFVPRHHSKHVYDPPLYTASKVSFITHFSRLPNFETFTRALVVHFDSLADLFAKLAPAQDARIAALRHTMAARVAASRRERLGLWQAALR
mmetsp:Transcript_14004/g.49297  ORF Transcript_14004/g.49297 Transcript_14004/m.49297 type:complete len:659 (-) Transcript_14004:31-2007(-)